MLRSRFQHRPDYLPGITDPGGPSPGRLQHRSAAPAADVRVRSEGQNTGIASDGNSEIHPHVDPGQSSGPPVTLQAFWCVLFGFSPIFRIRLPVFQPGISFDYLVELCFDCCEYNLVAGMAINPNNSQTLLLRLINDHTYFVALEKCTYRTYGYDSVHFPARASYLRPFTSPRYEHS